jgi:hypothetical protein
MQFHKALVMLALLACSSAAAAERSLLQNAAMDDLSAVSIPQATLAASALRVATVQATPAGPVFTLAGQLDSASQLLQAMAASQVSCCLPCPSNSCVERCVLVVAGSTLSEQACTLCTALAPGAG